MFKWVHLNVSRFQLAVMSLRRSALLFPFDLHVTIVPEADRVA
jgi:hypothetical protein